MTNPSRIPLADRIRGCHDRHPEWDVARIASAVRGSNRTMIAAVLAGEPIPDPPQPKNVRLVSEPGIVDLDAVTRRYDIAAAIRDELSRLPPGKLMVEREMCQRTAGRDTGRFRRAVENTDEFRSNRVKLRLNPDQPEGSWYWGNRDDVTRAVRLRDE